jgi:polar amino acid transport system substrate-binding protein
MILSIPRPAPVFVFMLALTSLVIGAKPGQAEQFTITITEWCPYMCTETDDQGFTTDIVEAAFKSQGHEVQFLPLPWLRALDLTRQGETDGSLAPAKAEAPDFIYPDLPVSHQQMCFFTRADHDWTYDGIPSLSAIRFGFLSNLSLPGIMDYVDENRRSQAVQPISDEHFMRKNFNKIDHGRIDALIDDQNVVFYYMKQQGTEDETYRVAGCLDREPIYLGFTPKRPEQSARMAGIYEAGLQSIGESGELTAILLRYGTPGAAPMM